MKSEAESNENLITNTREPSRNTRNNNKGNYTKPKKNNKERRINGIQLRF